MGPINQGSTINHDRSALRSQRFVVQLSTKQSSPLNTLVLIIPRTFSEKEREKELSASSGLLNRSSGEFVKLMRELFKLDQEDQKRIYEDRHFPNHGTYVKSLFEARACSQSSQ